MADLESRVRVLEEDAAILKGEIKSVLLEVRTTLLSQSNPFTSSSMSAPVFAMPPEPPQESPPPIPMSLGDNPFLSEEPNRYDAKPDGNRNAFAQPDARFDAAAPEPLYAAQQPVPLPMAPRRSWELNTLAMLLAWCQSNMTRLSSKEMTSLLSLAGYGGIVDEELAAILLDISGSFDQGKEGRAATVSEYLLALHELHSVIKDEEEPAVPRLRRAG